MPQKFIVEAVLRAVETLPGFPNLDVLDLSCGEGEILSRLQKRGCRVRGTHYREDDYIIRQRGLLDGVPVTSGVDLAGPLPFPDASFDLVTLTEVLEHLENHFHVLHEAARLVRPGGWLLLTTPNIFRLHSRFRFLLTGKHKLIRRRLGWDVPWGEHYAYHINPVDFPVLHAVLRQQGLRLERVGFTRFKLKSLLFLPLVPLVWLACRLTVDRDARPEGAFREGERDLNRWLSHPALLGSEQLLVLARRPAQAA